MTTQSKLPLRTLLAFDAATCLAMGAGLLLASGPIAEATHLPTPLLFWAGASLIPIGGFMAATAWPRRASLAALRLIILGNLRWVIVSLALPFTGIIVPNTLGWAILLGQSTVVAALAKLEFDAGRSPGGVLTVQGEAI